MHAPQVETDMLACVTMRYTLNRKEEAEKLSKPSFTNDLPSMHCC
jgi:hypothetical protein